MPDTSTPTAVARRSRGPLALRSCALLLAATLALTGCTVASPVTVDQSTISTDVLISATMAVSEASVKIDYTLTNQSGVDLWVVHHQGPSAIPDQTRSNGVALSLAFFPVRGDVNYVRPPATFVAPVAASGALTGSLTASRPFQPYADLPGDRKVSVPTHPTSVRLCIGYVIAAEVPPDAAPKPVGESDYPALYRAVGFPLQHLACSAPTPLP